MPNVQADDYQAPNTEVALDGFMSITSGKVCSIISDEPAPGWVTLGFSDENNEFSLNATAYFVPAPLFVKASLAYLTSLGYVIADPE